MPPDKSQALEEDRGRRLGLRAGDGPREKRPIQRRPQTPQPLADNRHAQRGMAAAEVPAHL
eukprot:3285341-Lingulodinium_polyedra.AAC.1